MMKNIFLLCLSMTFLFACQDKPPKDLPIYGIHEYLDNDTIYHTIPNFSLLDQDSNLVENTTLSNHIYVADFFFTYCPSICPKVTKQMLRLYDIFEKEENIKFVSFTLDPLVDNVENLNLYAKNLAVRNDKWLFLTGDKDEIWELADDYFVAVLEDEDAPGGMDHSGKMILIDTEGHIRGFAEGTDPEDVTEFIPTIKQLLDEHKTAE